MSTPSHAPRGSITRARRLRTLLFASIVTGLVQAGLSACSGNPAAAPGDGADGGSVNGSTPQEDPSRDGASARADGALEDGGVDACTADPCVTSLALGYQFACAVLSDGTVRCWGDNAQGTLGREVDGGFDHRPAPVPGLEGIRQVAAGFYHACALGHDDTVHCWGGNAFSQLGDDGPTRKTPVKIDIGDHAIRSIHAGGYFTCALLESGKVLCWGDNSRLQLGADASAVVAKPFEVPTVGGAHELSAGDRFNCVRLSSGSVACFGSDSFGQLGRGAATADDPSPAPVVGLGSVASLPEANAYHSCAVETSGVVSCWGLNSGGQCGVAPDAGSVVAPVHVAVSDVVEVSPGGVHTCARRKDGTVTCWGANDDGEIGLDPATAGTRILQPTPVAGITDAVRVSAGYTSTCAIIAGGRVQCWGRNAVGELGRPGPDGGYPTAQPTPGFVEL